MFAYQSPIPGAKVVSGWGRPREYRGGWHEGLDFAVSEGTPVRAVAGGKVLTSVFGDGPEGNMISVAHADGTLSRYMHLSKRLVEKGASVSAGQLIAYSGATGIARSAAHLHFDLRANASALASYLRQYGTPKRLDNGRLVPELGRNMAGYTGIPAETFVPAVLTAPVIAQAKQQGIPLYSAAGGIVAVVGLLGAAYWLVLR
jgi:murein DD-endopeptidase MepM/ murein hydrolase activator NlpD